MMMMLKVVFAMISVCISTIRPTSAGVVVSCYENLDSTKIIAPLNFVDTSKYMASRLPQVAETDGLIDKLFRTLRIDDSQTGTFINAFQDKNTSPLGEPADVCGGNTFLICRPGAAENCAVWTGATAVGGGDAANDQFGAIHIGTQAIANDPSAWRIIVILYTNTRPHLPEDSPAGFTPVPSTGGYNCQSSQYVSVAQLDERLVSLGKAPMIAIVAPGDVDYYEQLLGGLSVPFAVRPWGTSRDGTLSHLYEAVDAVLCGGGSEDSNASPKWDKVEKKEGNIALNATHVEQGEEGSAQTHGKIFGLSMGGKKQFLQKKFGN